MDDFVCVCVHISYKPPTTFWSCRIIP